MKKYIIATMLGAAAVFGMRAQDYKVQVTTADGTVHTFETTDVSKITFTDTPNYIPADRYYMASYATSGDNGLYQLRLANCPMDEYGEPGVVGGFELSLAILGEQSEDRLEAMLPDGYYTIGNGTKPMTWDATRSALYLRLAEGKDGISTQIMADGSVDVRRNGANYDIRIEAVLLTGEKFNCRYEGPINFEISSNEVDKFEQDIDITLTGGQGRFYGNWFYPFVSDMMLQLYSGDWNEDGTQQLNGYWVQLPIYMPKVTDPNGQQRVADGVYTMEGRNLNSFFNVPFTYQYGRMIDMWGIITPADSYVIYYNPDGVNKRALLLDGTMTVSGNGTKFELDMDTDTEGVHFHAVYNGNPLIRNFVDNSREISSEGTLTGDYDLAFNDNQVAFSFKNTDYIVKGLNWFEVYVTDPDYRNGDYLQLHFLADGDKLPDGTYTVDNSLKDKTGLKGAVSPGGDIVLSWMSDLSSADSEGVQSVIAPICGGTVTVTTTGDQKRKLVFNLKDDKGHTVSGTYEGLFGDIDAGDLQEAPARTRALKAPRR